MKQNFPIILASGSPRRKEICEKLGLSFEVKVPADEPAISRDDFSKSLSEIEALSLTISKHKAVSVFKETPSCCVIGSDTIVLVNPFTDNGRKILGKPRDINDARLMLSALSGNTHRVYTSVWLCHPENAEESGGFISFSEVTFNEMTENDIEEYIQTGEPFDKAGAYGIQGAGIRYIKEIKGDFYTVMGLPGAKLWHFLKKKSIIY